LTDSDIEYIYYDHENQKGDMYTPMRMLAILALMGTLALSGCVQSAALTVTLNTPTGGSTVSTTTPTLAWSSSGTADYYRLQIAADSNFQNIIIDSTNLREPSYTVHSGDLSSNQSYYWRVSAYSGNQTTGWSSGWSFRIQGQAPAGASISVLASVDGLPWSGDVSFSITGPHADYGSSAPTSFTDLTAGTYTVTYSSGGPEGATLGSISPSPTQTLSGGGSMSFTLNFHKQAKGAIAVNALVDGIPWSGNLDYSILGPYQDANSYVPGNFSDLPSGTYTLTYNHGGPSDAVLMSITPSPTQTLSRGGVVNFTLNFHRSPRGVIAVEATLDGAPWSGLVNYTITGPRTDSNNSVPANFSNIPSGTYTLSYNSGGPAGATLVNIAPSPVQNMDGGSIYFTLNFHRQARYGAIEVHATTGGQAVLGHVSFVLSGPATVSGTAPARYNNMPAGTYTLSVTGGQPIGVRFEGISPSPTQNLDPGGRLVFDIAYGGVVAPPGPPMPGPILK